MAEHYRASDSIEHDISYLVKNWKTIMTLSTILVGGAIFYYRLSVGLEKIEKQETKQSITDQVLAGQNRINDAQLQTNNLLVEMIKEIRRDMRWKERSAPAFGPYNDSRRTQDVP